MFGIQRSRHGLGVGVTLLLTLMLLISLVGCGSAQQAGTTNQGKTSSEATGKKPLLAFAQKSLGYYFFVTEEESVKRAAEAQGWRFQATNADNDSATQMNQYINFIAEKPIAIVSDPIDSEGLITAINKASDAGIPSAVIDTPTTGGKVAITVAFDNKKAGEMAAQEIVKRLKQKYGVPKGIVLNAYGAMSSLAWRLRKEGFDEVMKKYPSIKLLDVPGEGDVVKTHDALINALAQYPNIDAVSAPSDTPAMGLYEALKEKKKLFKVGEPGHIIFVTIDDEPIANQRIKEGYYDASINQDAVAYGQIAVELLTKYTLKGKAVPLGPYTNDKYYWKTAEITNSPSGPSLVIPAFVVNKSNVNDPRLWGNIAWNKWGIRYK
ncbi:D-ribose-binding periplasmic protein precursor [Peptococcaceae bacterium CEB3]|nr:D-ribose-binding periplasmic protein precursor [Peptococcaceae bacterium CEB3]